MSQQTTEGRNQGSEPESNLFYLSVIGRPTDSE